MTQIRCTLHYERPYLPQAGDMWFAPWLLDDPERAKTLSPGYLARAEVRPPVVVKLPGGTEWCVDQLAYDARRGYHGEGWAVTGDPPALTASPSIQTGNWHGWLQDGVLKPC